MARIIGYIVAATAALVVLWLLFLTVLHTLMIGFWIVLAVVVGFGVFRIGRRSARGTRQ